MKRVKSTKKHRSPETDATLLRSQTVLLKQWDELLRLRRCVLKRAAPDDIHDLRVASRRLRASVGLFAPLSGAGSVGELKRSIRKLTRSLGGLRNLDEALLFFRSHTPLENAEDSRLGGILAETRTVELKRIHKALKAFDHKQLDKSVHKIAKRLTADRVRGGSRQPITTFFSETSAKLFQPIHDQLASATDPEQRESRHVLRIAIKKRRYFFEVMALVLERDYGVELGLLKEYQTALGRMNDVAEFTRLCRNLDLSAAEHEHVEKLLLAEDRLLLESFTALGGCKPLTDTFKL